MEKLHINDTAIDRANDSIEFLLAQHCLERNIPYLGIYRGSQLLNVACGGTLYQDVEKRCLKNQGIKRLAEIFILMACGLDGLIEAFYDPNAYNREEQKFIMGLQFHPERMCHDGQNCTENIFDYLGCPRLYEINLRFTSWSIIFSGTQEKVVEAYAIAAIKFRGLNAATNFDMSRYDVKTIIERSTLPIRGAVKCIKEANIFYLSVECCRTDEDMNSQINTLTSYTNDHGNYPSGNARWPMIAFQQHAFNVICNGSVGIL
ncbi:hypothetical protein SUGI_0914850 [Cryptomeria japonica]|nr:hypothetical protein SUGI_0914850 [Cryptomeria japonica]